jgi:hypothetical protein
MYKAGKNGGVIRVSDNVEIASDPKSYEWFLYSQWRAQGNEPAPNDQVRERNPE